MKTLAKPSHLHDREDEWDDLSRFALSPQPGLRLGIVYGRRRFGKSFLLRRLVEAMGGAYHLAQQAQPRPALDRFASSLSQQLGWAPPQPFRDWSDAMEQAVSALGTRRTLPQILVIDEYPYLQQSSPELDSAIQALIDEADAGRLTERWTAPVSIVLCGSAMSVMTKILSGTSPMRGRAALDMPLAQFDYRQARGYWGVDDHAAAFAIDTVVGGAAGYKDLTVAVDTPASADDLPAWLAATVLNPSHALFREDEYLLREDPRVTDEAAYYSLLQAVASGRTTQTEIAGTLARTSNSINHHLEVMTTAGFVVRHEDLFAARRPSYRVADPIVRFNHLINRRHRAWLEDRRALEVWADAAVTYRSQIVGPHFESMCRLWTDRYASDATLGDPAGPSASVQVNDREERQAFELDVVALRRGARASSTKTVQFIGEAKAYELGVDSLERLDRLGDLLAGHSGIALSPTVKRLLFSAEGFTADLADAARTRPDVELVDLDRLYEGN